MNFKQRAAELWQYTIDFRRELHMYPEPSLQEHRTSRRIKEELERLAIPYESVGETGICATIEGGAPGRTILLRGDMDALSVQEQTGLPFASTVDGMMHACGHDCHTAMLLTAGRMLNEVKEQLPGRIKLAFQPAEELAAGAKMMVEHGVLDGVDTCFGAHVMGHLPYGKVHYTPGYTSTAASSFEILVEGKSGHGASPHLTIDPIMASAGIVSALQTIVSREVNPMSPVVVTIGEIFGGSRFNVIADSVRMTGTARALDQTVFDDLESKIRRIVEHTAAAYRANGKLRFDALCGCVKNDDHMLSLACRAAGSIFGTDAVEPGEPLSGSEDFAEFSARRPSAFLFLGSGIEGQEVFSNHHGKFCVDERVLLNGSATYAQVAADYLQQGLL